MIIHPIQRKRKPEFCKSYILDSANPTFWILQILHFGSCKSYILDPANPTFQFEGQSATISIVAHSAAAFKAASIFVKKIALFSISWYNKYLPGMGRAGRAARPLRCRRMGGL
jgi:hypothetical protein